LGTLLGRDDQPGEIAGWGPVPASVARTLTDRARAGERRYAVLDGDGRLLFDGTTRHRPHLAPDTGAGARGGVTARGGIVELHVPLTLLTDPELTARHPGWARLIGDLRTQYDQQRPIDQDPAARFPGRRLRRHTQTLAQRCIFAGCRRPATDCDLDHHRDHHRGGRTEPLNLGPGCRHDHGLKTSGGWRLTRHDQHTYLWTSPLGRRHLVHVEPIAAPLPAPIPRTTPAETDLAAYPDPDPPATFQPQDRRGRPLDSEATAARKQAGAVGTAADLPPPF
jgi:hypothetical protein